MKFKIYNLSMCKEDIKQKLIIFKTTKNKNVF
jgi:hypothetical protein